MLRSSRILGVSLSYWNLPSMPAGRLAYWVAQRRHDSDIPVIILANAVEAEDAVPRVAGVLCKPFSMPQMLDEVRRVLRERRPTAA